MRASPQLVPRILVDSVKAAVSHWQGEKGRCSSSMSQHSCLVLRWIQSKDPRDEATPPSKSFRPGAVVSVLPGQVSHDQLWIFSTQNMHPKQDRPPAVLRALESEGALDIKSHTYARA